MKTLYLFLGALIILAAAFYLFSYPVRVRHAQAVELITAINTARNTTPLTEQRLLDDHAAAIQSTIPHLKGASGVQRELVTNPYGLDMVVTEVFTVGAADAQEAVRRLTSNDKTGPAVLDLDVGYDSIGTSVIPLSVNREVLTSYVVVFGKLTNKGFDEAIPDGVHKM